MNEILDIESHLADFSIPTGTIIKLFEILQAEHSEKTKFGKEVEFLAKEVHKSEWRKQQIKKLRDNKFKRKIKV